MNAPRLLDAMGAFVYSHDVGGPSDRQIKKAGEAGVPSVGRTVGPAFTKRHKAPRRIETPSRAMLAAFLRVALERPPPTDSLRLFFLTFERHSTVDGVAKYRFRDSDVEPSGPYIMSMKMRGRHTAISCCGKRDSAALEDLGVC